jgi:hypothetical protein
MRGWISPKALLAGGCALLSACATNMEYVPTEQVSAQLQGRPASQYRVPPESPRGDVTVVSRGVVHVERDGHRADVLHVAVRLSNDQDSGPWTFDVREQKLLVPVAGSITPAPVSPAAGGAPVVNVAPGGQRTMDLYFPTPPGVKTNRLHAFDLLWTVRTPQRIVTERTPFEGWGSDGYRYGPFSSVSVGFGLGPMWWYEPLYYRPYYPFRYPYWSPSYGYGYGYGYAPRHFGYQPYRPGARALPPVWAPPAPAMPSPRPAPPMPSVPMQAAPAPPPAPPPPPPPPPAVPSQPNISAPAPR